MLGDQNQKVDNNSLAIQAGRDVHIGMTFTEVEKIVSVLFDANFPKLKADAASEAIKNVKEYLANLDEKLKQNSDKIDQKKFSDPDVQYLLNEIVTATARKGKKMDQDILSELLVERLNKQTSIISTVSEQAMRVIPMLDKKHIHFLSLIQFLREMTFNGISDVNKLEFLFKLFHSHFKEGENLSDPNKLYLQSLGLLTYLGMTASHLDLNSRYPILNNINPEKTPTINYLSALYTNERLYNINRLTPTGQLIGLLNLKRCDSTIDISIWIH